MRSIGRAITIPNWPASITDWTERKFAAERDYRGWEPGGDEFLSPALSVALLMSRVRERADFAPWFEAFLLDNGALEARFNPAHVSDRSDGKTAHLDGLNLSRAWALRSIRRALAPHPAESTADRKSPTPTSHPPCRTSAATMPGSIGSPPSRCWRSWRTSKALREG